MARKKPVSKTKTEEDKNTKILQELNNAEEDGEINTYVNETLFIDPANGKNYVVPVETRCIPPGLGPIMSATPEWETGNAMKQPIPQPTNDYSKTDPFMLNNEMELCINFKIGVTLTEIAEFVEKIKRNVDPDMVRLFTVRMAGVYSRE